MATDYRSDNLVSALIAAVRVCDLKRPRAAHLIVGKFLSLARTSPTICVLNLLAAPISTCAIFLIRKILNTEGNHATYSERQVCSDNQRKTITMKDFCSICTSTHSLTAETIPDGFGTSRSFFRCDECTLKLSWVTIAGLVSKSNDPVAFWKDQFYVCPHCQGVYYCPVPGVAYAYGHNSINECADCGSPMHMEDNITIQLPNAAKCRVVESDNLYFTEERYGQWKERVLKSTILRRIILKTALVKPHRTNDHNHSVVVEVIDNISLVRTGAYSTPFVPTVNLAQLLLKRATLSEWCKFQDMSMTWAERTSQLRSNIVKEDDFSTFTGPSDCALADADLLRVLLTYDKMDGMARLQHSVRLQSQILFDQDLPNRLLPLIREAVKNNPQLTLHDFLGLLSVAFDAEEVAAILK